MVDFNFGEKKIKSYASIGQARQKFPPLSLLLLLLLLFFLLLLLVLNPAKSHMGACTLTVLRWVQNTTDLLTILLLTMLTVQYFFHYLITYLPTDVLT